MRQKLLAILVLLLVSGSILAQERVIRGKITAESDASPLVGVSVLVTGTNTATSTNASGEYNITLPAGAQSLTFSFIGFTSQTIQIGNRTTIDAALITDVKELGEIMVVAYGTAKKESFTGSASVVKESVLANRPVTSFEKALQGAASGVQVTSVSGQPGATSTVRIRGVGSFTASSTPLYVVDGIAITNGDLSQIATTSDVLSSLNPNDIASLTVLKDATAAAIYGSRAANGVILITTKQGKAGKTRFNGTISGGISSQAVKKHEVMNASEYYKFYWDQYYNSQLANGILPDAAATAANKLTNDKLTVTPYNTANPYGANGVLASGARLYYDTDWRDEVLRRGVIKNVDLSASGGNEKTKFFISTGFFDQKGIVIGSDFKRYSARFNLSTDVTKNFTMGLNNSLSYTIQNTPAGSTGGANPVQFADITSNIYSVYVRDAEGKPTFDAAGKPIYNYVNPVAPDFNPIGLNELDEYKTNTARGLINPYAELRFLNDFAIKTSVGIDYITNRERQFYNPEHGNGLSVKGRGYRYSREDLTLTMVNTLTYNKNFGEHNLNVLLGQEAYRTKLDNIYAQATNFAYPGAEELISASTPNAASSTFSEKRMSSYFSRVTYDYLGKYYFSGSLRRDGSSVFGVGNRYGVFYSIGGAWRIGKESFLNGASFLDELKLRASYGTSGNDRIERYASQGLYESRRNYEGQSGILYSQLANPLLKWEQSSTLDIGLEFAILGNLISGEISYYNRGSKGLLFNRPLSRLTGFPSIITNLASMDNYGLDMMLKANPVRSNDFDWEVSLNLTSNNNKIKQMTQNEVIDGTKQWKVGGDIYQWYLREYAGVSPTNGKALWYISDTTTGTRDTTSNYSRATRYRLGSALPKFTGGFNNTLKYKNFDFSVFTYFSLGGKIYDALYANLMHGGKNAGKQLSPDMYNAWKKAGDVSDIPRPFITGLTRGTGDDANTSSSRFLVDGSYMRVKNITLGYALPGSMLRSATLSSLRLYVMAENPFTFAKRKGMDPEVSINGLNDNDVPNIKTFSAGLTVGF